MAQTTRWNPSNPSKFYLNSKGCTTTQFSTKVNNYPQKCYVCVCVCVRERENEWMYVREWMDECIFLFLSPSNVGLWIARGAHNRWLCMTIRENCIFEPFGKWLNFSGKQWRQIIGYWHPHHFVSYNGFKKSRSSSHWNFSFLLVPVGCFWNFSYKKLLHACMPCTKDESPMTFRRDKIPQTWKIWNFVHFKHDFEKN